MIFYYELDNLKSCLYLLLSVAFHYNLLSSWVHLWMSLLSVADKVSYSVGYQELLYGLLLFLKHKPPARALELVGGDNDELLSEWHSVSDLNVHCVWVCVVGVERREVAWGPLTLPLLPWNHHLICWQECGGHQYSQHGVPKIEPPFHKHSLLASILEGRVESLPFNCIVLGLSVSNKQLGTSWEMLKPCSSQEKRPLTGREQVWAPCVLKGSSQEWSLCHLSKLGGGEGGMFLFRYYTV